MNFCDELRTVLVDDEELLLFFNTSDKYTLKKLPKECFEVYDQSSGELYIKIQFADGILSDVKVGKCLNRSEQRAELIAKLKEVFCNAENEFVPVECMLAQRPLIGFYECPGHFRISGMTAELFEAGQCPLEYKGRNPAFEYHCGPPFPFSMEVCISQSPNSFIQHYRTKKKSEETAAFLSVLLAYNVHRQVTSGRRVWVQRKGSEKNEFSLMVSVTPKFGIADLAKFGDKVGLDASSDYYNKLWFKDEVVMLPRTFDADLRRFYGLPLPLRKKFVRACTWYMTGLSLMPQRRLTPVYCAAAIESLIPLKGKGEYQAGEKTPGISLQFRAMLDKYVGAKPLGNMDSKTFYAVRSALVHGSKNLQSTVIGSWEEDDILLQAVYLTLTKRCLIGWLRNPVVQLKNGLFT